MGFNIRGLNKLVILIIITSVITGCSIQKGHYLNGYHVKWNKNIEAKDYSNTKKINSGNTNETNNTDNLSASSDAEPVPINIQKVPNFYPEKIISSDSTKKAKLKKRDAKKKQQPQLKQKKNIKEKKSRTKHQAILSLIFGSISTILGILSAILIYTAFYYFTGLLSGIALMTAIFFICVACVMGFNAMITGFILLYKIKKSPEESRYKKPALLATIFGSIGIAAFIGLIAWLMSLI